jgi:hypothetical protein
VAVVVRYGTTLEVPLERAPAFEKDFEELVARHEATAKQQQKPVVLSTDFVELGLTAPVQKLLIDAEIKTLPQLKARSEQEVLAIEGIGYPYLRMINTRLLQRAVAGSHLRGARAKVYAGSVESVMEAVKFKELYGDLKRAGFDLIDDVTGVDGVELHRRLGSASTAVIGVFREEGYAIEALKRGRVLTDIPFASSHLNILRQANITRLPIFLRYTRQRLAEALAQVDSVEERKTVLEGIDRAARKVGVVLPH